jgi:hypothetical protein
MSLDMQRARQGGHGADLIGRCLLHDDLSSTQVYTHVSIQRLKAVHARTHPDGAPARPPLPRPSSGTADAPAPGR